MDEVYQVVKKLWELQGKGIAIYTGSYKKIETIFVGKDGVYILTLCDICPHRISDNTDDIYDVIGRWTYAKNEMLMDYLKEEE